MSSFSSRSLRPINQERLYNLFRDMVDIYSPSGREEELTMFLNEYLRGRGLSVILRPVDETRFNLEITPPGGKPDTLFLGHIDTVPAFDPGQAEFAHEEGMCRGLGTADMKGGCAAMLEAFITASEGGYLPGGVMLSLVVGEEEAGDGTAVLLESYRFNQALVGEPTNLNPCDSHYGYLEMLLQVKGYRRHAALSGRHTNSTRALLRLLLRLEDYLEQEMPRGVLNIRDLHSSESGFAVPDSCSAALDLHMPPDQPVSVASEQVQGFLDNLLKTELQQEGLEGFTLDFPFIAEGYTLEPDNPLLVQLKTIYGTRNRAWTPQSFRSHSDANLLRDAGCSPVILGPGRLALAHTRDEGVVFSQVAEAAEIYNHLLAAGAGRN